MHALLQALLVHRLLVHGFTNRDLRTLIAPLLGKRAEDITAGQMTYDLRRLRAHGLIERIPRTRRYTVTDTGLQHALLFTHAHDHLLRAGLAQVSDPSPPRQPGCAPPPAPTKPPSTNSPTKLDSPPDRNTTRSHNLTQDSRLRRLSFANGASPQPDEACLRLPVSWGLRSGGDRDRRTGPVYEPHVAVSWPAGRPSRSEPIMTVARSVGDVFTEHVQFEIECIDRMYLNVYVPHLQFAAGLVGYVQRQLGLPIASTAPLAKITDAFSTAVHRFAKVNRVPWIDFVKGQRKDDVMHEHLARFTATEGVVFVGRAQEKTKLFRTEKRHDANGDSYPWIVKTTGLVNHFYFYCVDADFGPFFLKFCSYFPYNAKLCLNGNEWAKRQAAKAGIGFTALDNGFAAVDDPVALQGICDRLGPEQIDALLRKWLAILPHPFTAADRAAGYRYDLSILQAEFSLTQMLDKPVSGRMFFEQVIRDNLDIGRPDQVAWSSTASCRRRGPRATPGRFRTRVITYGVTPSLHVDYKHTRIKQYHKEGRALRTETTINDTRDFGSGND